MKYLQENVNRNYLTLKQQQTRVKKNTYIE